MSTAVGRRQRKKELTRQTISDRATALFLERGFDAVSIAEIAEVADVAVQTVFNHFPTKEDLFFDELGWVTGAADAIRARPADRPTTVLADEYRSHLDRLRDRGHLESAPRFQRTLDASLALRDRRARLAEQHTQLLSEALLDTAHPGTPPWRTRLLAARLSATRRVLDGELVRLIEQHGAGEALDRIGPIVDEAFSAPG